MKTVGSRAEVWHGTAKKTSGGLLKKDLKKNKRGRIVSKKMSNRAKKEKRLEKAGYKTKKGVFKKFKAKKKGGMNGNGNGNETNKGKRKRKREEINYKLRVEAPAMLRRLAMASPPATIQTIPSNPYKHMLGFLDKRNLNSLHKVNKTRGNLINNRILEILIKNYGNIDEALGRAIFDGWKSIKDKERLNILKDEINRSRMELEARRRNGDHITKSDNFQAHQNELKYYENLFKELGGKVINRNWETMETDVIEILKILLKNGANIDYQSEGVGFTPLILSIYYGMEKTAEFLIKKGANKKIRDNEGHNAEYYAENYKMYNILELLKSHHNSKGGSKKRRKRKTTKRKSKK